MNIKLDELIERLTRIRETVGGNAEVVLEVYAEEEGSALGYPRDVFLNEPDTVKISAY